MAKAAWVLGLASVVAWYGLYRVQLSTGFEPLVESTDERVFEIANHGGALLPGGEDTVVVFSKFDCPWCAQVWSEIDSLLADGNYSGPTFRFLQIADPNDARAFRLARAAGCATTQGRFREFARAAYTLGSDSDSSISIAVSRAAVPDLVAFDGCMLDSLSSAAVHQSNRSAISIGLTGTPIFLFRGGKVRGAVTIARLRELTTDIQ